MNQDIYLIASFIALVMSLPRGEKILTGKVNPPSVDQIYQAIKAWQGPQEKMAIQYRSNYTEAEYRAYLVETVDHVIDLMGGWSCLARACKRVKEIWPNRWQVFCLYWRYHNAPIRVLTTTEIAERCYINRCTVWRWAREVIPQHIALEALEDDERYSSPLADECVSGNPSPIKYRADYHYPGAG